VFRKVDTFWTYQPPGWAVRAAMVAAAAWTWSWGRCWWHDPGRCSRIRLEVGEEVLAVAPLSLDSTSGPISRRRCEEPRSCIWLEVGEEVTAVAPPSLDSTLGPISRRAVRNPRKFGAVCRDSTGKMRGTEEDMVQG
jgi:hypothetical protein